jgi:hypothetical protein
MSENFLEQALEQNKNTNAALYGYASLRQRQAQQQELQELSALQRETAKTESERLAIEKKRLKLELDRAAQAKSDAQSTKQLRRMMADLGSDLDKIACALK